MCEISPMSPRRSIPRSSMFRYALRPTHSQAIRHNHSVRDLMEKGRVGTQTPLGPYRTRIGKLSRLLQWTLIPGTFLYMALYADFGEHDHVFSEFRRTVQKKKGEFWELSPEERKIVHSKESEST